MDCKVSLVTHSNNGDDTDSLSAEDKIRRDKEREAEKLLQKGDQLYEEERYHEALKYLNQSSQINPDDPEVWNLLGLTYQALGCTREAWRSFKFALNTDPTNLNSLWYASEFLFDNEDYQLAFNLIERYLELETDPIERKEAESLREDILYHLSSSYSLSAGHSNLEEEIDEEDEQEVPEDEFTVIDTIDDELEQHEDSWSDEVEEDTEIDEFLADLTLQLTDRNSKCLNCGAMLPTDAPYCYVCKEPHLYEPLDD